MCYCDSFAVLIYIPFFIVKEKTLNTLIMEGDFIPIMEGDFITISFFQRSLKKKKIFSSRTALIIRNLFLLLPSFRKICKINKDILVKKKLMYTERDFIKRLRNNSKCLIIEDRCSILITLKWL